MSYSADEVLLKVGARSSPLSRVQVDEAQKLLRRHHTNIRFEAVYVETTGDQDKQTSLRGLDKTNFFTKELDELLLSEGCRVAVHSAKDLPEPILLGLEIVAITRGVDPADSLVLRHGETLETLRPGAVIATSSERREEVVRSLRPDLTFKDLRGNIGERLAQLESGAVDGVVLAEAALIRLQLTDRNRIRLPGPTAPLQGQLAILTRVDDTEMAELFRCLDTRELVPA